MTSPSRFAMCPEQLVTRDLSNMSIEAYHGGEPASVPFVWESEPGTPKFKSRDNPLPPLSPPPSYHYNSTSQSNKRKPKKWPSKPNLLRTIFLKRTTRKERSLSPSSSISSSSSSFTSVPSSPVRHSRKDDEKEADLYGVAVCDTARSGGGGCYSSMIKKVLLRDFL